jgi:adenylylsulfate kinase-like enzyme
MMDHRKRLAVVDSSVENVSMGILLGIYRDRCAKIVDNLMATVINIRSTSGGGKSYSVYHVMKKLGIKSSIMKDGKVVGYRLHGNVMVVGRYETDCGGCDQIKTQDMICERVERFADKGKVVLYEGLLVSGLYSRYSNLAKRLKHSGHQYIWAFMDTPLQECLRRTIARRRSVGNGKPFNPKHTVAKYWAVGMANQHALDDKEDVIMLPNHRHLYQIVQDILDGVKKKKILKRYESKMYVPEVERGYKGTVQCAESIDEVWKALTKVFGREILQAKKG